ncbi:glycosyltransferase family 39 protein [Curtobacterium luteum]|uniref:Glycosyltransferase RgtA/B/C/D-like domain-containing protein n=1 Tax=Curtobacterium luteum TaxID=33881 RepID=A0A175RGM4_9MICO|nr:hypothetical protein [Curtobacterium luteum]KTR02501.1 hypothetical protein NS184_15655 [Curtobacterium luteum]
MPAADQELDAPTAKDPSSAAAPGRAVRRAVPLWLVPVLVGVLAALVSAIGSWVPSAWADEAATMSAARRSLPELWRMVHHIDAVHGLYYAALHLWFTVVPYSPFTLRLPSALAVGVAAAFTVVLGDRLAGRWTGIVAGLVFAVLPRVTWAGTEGRSYAATAVVSVVLTLVLVVAVRRTVQRRGRPWVWWVLYGVLVLLSGLLFVYGVLVVAAHAVTLLLWVLRRRGPGGRGSHLRAALWWLVPTTTAALLLLPFVRLASGETGAQLFSLPELHWGPLLRTLVFTVQFFMSGTVLAWVGWALVVVGAVGTVVVPRLRARVPAVEVTLPVIVLPPVVVIAATMLTHPLYNARYFTFATPFVALAIALGLTLVPWRVVSALGLAVIVVLAQPQWHIQRLPAAKDSSTWAQAAADLTRLRAAEPRGTRDAVYYGPLPLHVNRTTEFVAAAYPEAFAGMRDLTLERSAVDIGQLWAQRRSATDPLPDLSGVDRVWFVGQPTDDAPKRMQQQLVADGWRVVTDRRDGGFLLRSFERSRTG